MEPKQTMSTEQYKERGKWMRGKKGKEGEGCWKQMAHTDLLQYMKDIEDFFSASSSPRARRQKIYGCLLFMFFS